MAFDYNKVILELGIDFNSEPNQYVIKNGENAGSRVSISKDDNYIKSIVFSSTGEIGDLTLDTLKNLTEIFSEDRVAIADDQILIPSTTAQQAASAQLGFEILELTQPIASFDRSEMFNFYILPLLQTFYSNRIAEASLDIVTRRTIEEWWEQNQASFSEKFVEISKAYSTGGKVGSLSVHNQFFEDLLSGRRKKATDSSAADSYILELFGYIDFLRENVGRCR
mgnify:CR=1 FL=1